MQSKRVPVKDDYHTEYPHGRRTCVAKAHLLSSHVIRTVHKLEFRLIIIT